MRRNHNYSSDRSTTENINDDNKYAESGESEFSRDLTVPFDENEVFTERHYVIGEDVLNKGRTEELKDYTGIGPKNYRRTDDKIYEEVCETLLRSPQVDASDIEVSVDLGVVTLQGTVLKRDFKRWAEKLIDDVPGIIDIHNELRVQSYPDPLVQNRTGLI